MSDSPVDVLSSSTGSRSVLSAAHSLPSAGTQSGCRTCGAPRNSEDTFVSNPSLIYAIGRIEPRFPTLGAEKELAQVVGKAGTAKLTDREAMHAVLSRPEYFYLVRQLCWVLTIESSDAYVVVPRDSEDIKMLLGTLRPTPRAGDIDVAVGWLGPLADGSACNGVRLPTVAPAQLYSFDVDSFVKHLSKPKDTSDQAFAATVEEVLQRASQLADNMGNQDQHRALNYLVTRDPLLYAEVANHYAQNASLVAVKVRVSALSAIRRVMEVVLEFRNRETDALAERFVSVDVSDVFPFKLSKWAPYTDRH